MNPSSDSVENFLCDPRDVDFRELVFCEDSKVNRLHKVIGKFVDLCVLDASDRAIAAEQYLRRKFAFLDDGVDGRTTWPRAVFDLLDSQNRERLGSL